MREGEGKKRKRRRERLPENLPKNHGIHRMSRGSRLDFRVNARGVDLYILFATKCRSIDELVSSP